MRTSLLACPDDGSIALIVLDPVGSRWPIRTPNIVVPNVKQNDWASLIFPGFLTFWGKYPSLDAGTAGCASDSIVGSLRADVLWRFWLREVLWEWKSNRVDRLMRAARQPAKREDEDGLGQ